MDVTVCICTHDRPGYLSDCLEGLRQQTVGDERFDILVVDSASTGDVPAQLARLGRGLRNARLLRVERAGVAGDALLTFDDPGAAYRAAREMAAEADRIIVFGSFLTVAAALVQARAHGA